MTEREYTVIYERTATGWNAYAPDLPGLGVGAPSREETETLIRDGIRIYLEELASLHQPLPEPQSYASTIRLSA